MTRFVLWCCVALAAGHLAGQETAPQPEDCVVRKGDVALASAEYKAKTYRFRLAGCKEQFLSDPERYSQLYDALAELAAAGEQVRPQPSSLVPS